jgi:hypothetical protein
MFKKAQAAMEFLMTYGWAILVVLAAIGALAYFGVLSPGNLLPEKCEFPSGLTCTETAATSISGGLGEQICFPVTNTLGYNAQAVSAVDVAGSCTAAAGVAINNGANAILCFDQCGLGAVVGDRINLEVEISYTSAETGLTKSSIGKIAGKWAA